MMEQLMRAKAIRSPAGKDFEEMRISKSTKSALDKEITKELKEGWVIKNLSVNNVYG